MKKIFIFLVVMLFGMVLVGCNEENKNSDKIINDSPTVEQKNKQIITENDKELENNPIIKDDIEQEFNHEIQSDEDEQRTGPMVNYCIQFETFLKFKEFIIMNKKDNNYILSFDFDDNEKIGNKSYIYESIVNSSTLYDLFTDNYSLSYTFESYNYPIGSGVDNQYFKISCLYMFNNIEFEEISSIEMKIIDDDGYIKNYLLYVNNQNMMKISISFPNIVNQNTINEIIDMLEKNIVLIK